MLYEVHLFSNGALPDDIIPRLKDFKLQLGEHGGDKVGVGVGEQGHRRHQLPAIKVDDFLRGHKEKALSDNGKSVGERNDSAAISVERNIGGKWPLFFFFKLTFKLTWEQQEKGKQPGDKFPNKEKHQVR